MLKLKSTILISAEMVQILKNLLYLFSMFVEKLLNFMLRKSIIARSHLNKGASSVRIMFFDLLLKKLSRGGAKRSPRWATKNLNLEL